MGSNMAEQHPVGFQWVVEAKERGAKVIHVDPRFTRTSALADLHVPLRAGSDIVFLGGLIHQVLEREAWFDEYVRNYTNAPVLIDEDFRDTEDLDGLFSGFDPETRTYDNESWGYARTDTDKAAGDGEAGAEVSGEQAHGAHGMRLQHGDPPQEDPTLQDPRCVFQILRRHFSRYTPEMVEESCGCPRELFLRVADWMCENSGRERTSAIAYAVGWTQHTTGVQNIRAASILQLLLGNIGRPGGGILALRGHANIQGSTDIPTLYNILPGYLPMPGPPARGSVDRYVDLNAPKTGVWGEMRSYVVSLLKAWWGDAATPANDFCFDYLPRIDGDHSHYPMMMRMLDGDTKGMLCVGQNPAVGSGNTSLQRRALGSLEWLVVRDVVEVESAAFWYDSPEIETGELRSQDIGTEVFFLPAATHVEKDGCFTNTQRLLQWHEKAVDPPGDCRSDLWFMYHLGRRIREKLAGSRDPKDRPILDLTWDYPVTGAHSEPDAAAVLQEINGRGPDGEFVSRYQELRDDGSTSAGCWILAGIYADGVNQPARRRPGAEQNWIASEWGWAWPANTRILYNRASADPEGRPWSERKRYVWWDADAGSWTGLGDHPDFKADKAPDYTPEDEDATGIDALDGADPFIIHPDGLAWLYAPAGLVDGPLPAHYEAQESPFANPLYGQQANPTRQVFERAENPYNPTHGDAHADVFPFALTTYRLTEHHTAGGMSRSVAYLAELQPELFCEVSPQLAAQRGLENGGWATIVTTRTAIEARVLVTERVVPLRVAGRELHQVGVPYHWGRKGLVTGDSANDLLSLALDLNVHINEYKVATCDVRPGRRPRGPALLDLVRDYRERAGVSP
jgi:formate dehydrogenase major subunit